MFEGCKSLFSLDISNFNTSNVWQIWEMFRDCSKLEYLNFRNIKTRADISLFHMFYQCKSLKYLNLFSLTEGVITIKMFDGTAYNFIYCIESPSNILNIISYLNGLNARNNCSDKCFNGGEYSILEKRCRKDYIYNSRCVSE